MRILIVEDEARLARILWNGLKAEQFAVDMVASGEDAIEFVAVIDYDLIVLDIGLPKLDGLSVLKQLRRKRMIMPVLLLSARGSVQDKVRGFEAGGDDYVVKPFAFEELLARIHALLRRPPVLMDTLNVADLELDRIRHRAKRAGKSISLTQREYAMLEYLMLNAGSPITRTRMVEHVWNLDFEGMTNIVDVYINYLRKKVDQGFDYKLIHTARGIGYMLVQPQNVISCTPHSAMPEAAA